VFRLSGEEICVNDSIAPDANEARDDSRRPPWVEAINSAFPALETDLEVDIAIVGGGITGLTAAYLLAKAGHRVAVFERDRIGRAETGHTTAHLTARPDLAVHEMVSSFGVNEARMVWAHGLDAIRRIETVCVSEQIDAHFERVDGWVIAHDQSDLPALEREAQAIQEIGGDVDFPAVSPFSGSNGMRIPNQARFHPGRYLEGLALAARAHGAAIFERSPVVKLHAGQITALEIAGPGQDDQHPVTVRAKRVILATHVPVLANPILLDKLTPNQTYAIGLSVPAGTAPDVLADDTLEPYHYYRLEPGAGTDGQDLVIFGGEDHPTGQTDPDERHFQALEDALRTWLPGVAAKTAYRWSGEVWESLDGLPYIGPDPSNKQHFVATGFDGVGMTFGTLAGEMAADWATDQDHPLADLLKPSRVSLSDVPGLASHGIGFAARFIKDRLFQPKESLDALENGHGALLEVEHLGRVAAYKDENGQLHTLSSICPHAGCVVAWNDADRTWDCPCHGSRFHATGEVRSGPAVVGLKVLLKGESASRSSLEH
jgi:glycine/D-amino acid oxidase-like deaminating enzyme